MLNHCQCVRYAYLATLSLSLSWRFLFPTFTYLPSLPHPSTHSHQPLIIILINQIPSPNSTYSTTTLSNFLSSSLKDLPRVWSLLQRHWITHLLQLVLVVVAAVAYTRNNWHYCCMSVEYYTGIYYAELANPLQWPQLRKKRRHVAPPQLPNRLLLRRPNNSNHHRNNNNSGPPLPPSFPPSILLPKPLLPKVFYFYFNFVFFSIN